MKAKNLIKSGFFLVIFFHSSLNATVLSLNLNSNKGMVDLSFLIFQNEDSLREFEQEVFAFEDED